MKCRLRFDEGTLLFDGDSAATEAVRSALTFDERIGVWRAPAFRYAGIMRALHAFHAEVEDCARNYDVLDCELHSPYRPMPHQTSALEAWLRAKCRGCVVMPTGSGKTFFAFLAMRSVRRSTIVVVPTIDLMHQWASQLEAAFQCRVGMLGGGSRDVRPVTVSTYDSAALHMNRIGDRFGLAVFDECHHLPGPVNRIGASMCIAPYRLGLSATLDLPPESAEVMRDLIGPQIYDADMRELKETGVLAPYRTIRLRLALSEREASEYREAHEKYASFIRANRIDFRSGRGWSDFLIACVRRPDGREAFQAYLRQRAIARCGEAKTEALWKIVRENRNARILIFTADNDTAYKIGETFCFPVLTHKTKAAERKDFLARFRSGDYPVLVTSKVLNEGVDVPEANIGIVVSGSGCTREHVQRLGRILRRKEGKEAVLYELVSDGTSEVGASDRRRRHQAYGMRRG